MIKEMEEPILWQIGGITLHAKTLVMTWVAMIIIFVFCMSCVRKLTAGKPGKMQNLLEWIVDFVRKLVNENMSYEKGRPLLAYLCSLILFIFVSNMIGLLPNITFGLLDHVEFLKLGEVFHGATLQSPTADINATLALAILSIILMVATGIRYGGKHYFGHFIRPNPVFFPVHIIDLGAKPMSLACRLFGNIFAGEVLISMILKMPGIWVIAGALPMFVWLGFSTFIGGLQAFVFTVLTIAYIGQAVEAGEH